MGYHRLVFNLTLQRDWEDGYNIYISSSFTDSDNDVVKDRVRSS